MSKKITEQDIIDSVASACQFISFYHPEDFVKGMVEAYENEKSDAAKNAIGQILINSKMCALGHRPLCQDTGSVNIFVKVGLKANLDITKNLEDLLKTSCSIFLKFGFILFWENEIKQIKRKVKEILFFIY